MRLGVKDCPVFGALGCIDLDTKKNAYDSGQACTSALV